MSRLCLDSESRRADFLGGETFGRVAAGLDPGTLPDSVVVRAADGRVLVRSEAVAYLLGRVGGAWSGPGRVLTALPSVLTDSASPRQRISPRRDESGLPRLHARTPGPSAGASLLLSRPDSAHGRCVRLCACSHT